MRYDAKRGTHYASSFRPTHIVQGPNGFRVEVMFVDGSLYTEREWDADANADWTFDDDAGLLFKGHVEDGFWFWEMPGGVK